MPAQTKLDLVTVGKRLKSVRQKLGLSLQDLATQLDLSPVSLSNLETGKGVSWQVLFAVLNHFAQQKIQIHHVFSLNYNEEYLDEASAKDVVANQINRRLDMINTEFSKEIILLKDFVKRHVDKKKR